MSKIMVHEKAFIPYFKHYPFEAVEQWGQALRDSIPKVLEGILKGVPDNETFRTKIVKLLIVAVRKMLGNGFIGPQGLPDELSIEIMKSKLKSEDVAKNFIDCVKLADEAFDQGELNSAMIAYYLGTSFGPNRFRDAIETAIGCLLPILQPGKEGEFKKKFGNQVEHSGKLISELAYDPQYIKQENDKINALINQYIRADIIPFETLSAVPTAQAGGGASHCDFVLIPDSVRPADSKEVRDIKYEIYRHFLGQEQADRVKAAWTEKDYRGIRIDPNEYIGHPEKPAYFDMNLDIQVSKKD